MAGKRHLAHRGPQAAIAAVVVGEQFVLCAQLVDGGDQALEQRGVVEVGHGVAELVDALREDRSAHAALAAAEVDQDQRGVAAVGAAA